MRENKFRAWDKVKKKMEYIGGFLVCEHRHCLICKCAHDGKTFYKDERVVYELMQYTGLKDKNGQEIYEGDLYSWVLRDGTLEKDRPTIVEWKTEDFNWDGGEMTGFSLGPNMVKEIKVIGNLYENPELLKV